MNDCQVHRGHVSDCGNIATFGQSTNLHITDIVAEALSDGLWDPSGPQRGFLARDVYVTTTAQGARLRDSGFGNHMVRVHVKTCTGMGFSSEVVSTPCPDTIYEDCIAEECVLGFAILGASGQIVKGLKYRGCQAVKCTGDGFYADYADETEYANCSARDNGTNTGLAAKARSGFHFDTHCGNRNWIRGSEAYNRDGTTQQYGAYNDVSAGGGAKAVDATLNYMWGNTTSDIYNKA